RAPNPHTNTYLAVSAFFISMLDGMRYAAGKSSKELYKEISKKPGEEAVYLEKGRQYVSEENIFDHYTQKEREKLFGKTPQTVWEIIGILKKELPVYRNTPLNTEIINSYYLSCLRKWLIEITEKEFVYIKSDIINMFRYPDKENDLDRNNWSEVLKLIDEIVKDDVGRISLMSGVVKEIVSKNYGKASERFIYLKERFSVLQSAYRTYRKNII
ncbi:MAG: hypothetical protein JXN63_02470, partial [Candidatus Delongbacteria bacterium]|nr:hypothetical protein [Candidatus Delongbacteria bacterium]